MSDGISTQSNILDLREKICSGCKKSKPLDEFHVCRRNKDGRKSECKKCGCKRSQDWYSKNPESIKIIRKRHRENNPGAIALYDRRSKLKRKFGITLEQYDQLLIDQDYTCAICKGSVIGTLHVDHCHITQKVRGLLCSECNLGLGKFKDDPELLKEALEYLNATK